VEEASREKLKLEGDRNAVDTKLMLNKEREEELRHLIDTST
jgi:hypothetical protein